MRKINMDVHPATGLIIIILLVLLNSVISAVEAALLGTNEANIRKDVEDGVTRSEKLLKVLENPRRYLYVIEVLSVTLSIAAGMVYSRTIAEYINSTWLASFYENGQDVIGFILMVLISLVLIFFIVLLGVVLPKRLAAREAEKHAYRLLSVAVMFAGILYPICWLLEKNVNVFLRIRGIDPNEDDDNVTEEEIISIVNEGQEQGVLDDDEAEMISNIIEFDEKQAKDIMTHRRKIVALSSEMDVEEAVDFMLNENFSRYPLYQDDIDNIIGMVNLKDAMMACRDPETRHKNIRKIARDPYFIPDTQSIDVLLEDMQSKKIHMAVAIDEYGQTAGIVAMEDILEEIVGDIQDEYDDEEEEVVAQDGSFMVRGFANLEELCEETGLELEAEDEGHFDTLNGLVISLLDRIPDDGETAEVTYGGFLFEILSVKSKMIDSVRMTRLPDSSEADEVSDDQA